MGEQTACKIQKDEVGDGARKRVHAQRDTIDKGPGQKSGRACRYVQRKSFSFSYMWRSGGHSYRFRVGTKRRRTKVAARCKRHRENVERDEGGRERRREKKTSVKKGVRRPEA